MPRRSSKAPTPFESAVKELRDLVAVRRASPVALGRVLARLTGNERIAAAAEVGLSRRSAYYFATIAEAVDADLLREEDVARLGVVRARTLARRALAAGQKISRSKVEAASRTRARAVAGSGAERAGEAELIDFTLAPRQAAAVRRALSLHGAPPGAGPQRRASAIAAICREAARRR